MWEEGDVARTSTGVPTSKDVARVAGVSQSTVSYVMSGKRPISEKTRRVVQDAIDELTYQPHAGARALASQRTNVIAVVMPFHSELSAHGLMAFAEEIALASRAHDYDVLMVTADEGPEGLRRVAGRALCDALVVMEVSRHDARAEVARSLALPTLFIGFPEAADDLHCIDFDFEEGARLLVSELVGAGARHVLVGGWRPDLTVRDINYYPRFRDSAVRCAADLGVPLDWSSVSRGTAGVEAFVDTVVAMSATDGRPPGIVVVDNVPEITNALARRGLLPGRDVDVVALVGHAEAESQHVPLTAVSTQPRDVSRRAMETLFDLLDSTDQPPGAKHLVAAELTRRDSARRPG